MLFACCKKGDSFLDGEFVYLLDTDTFKIKRWNANKLYTALVNREYKVFNVFIFNEHMLLNENARFLYQLDRDFTDGLIRYYTGEDWCPHIEINGVDNLIKVSGGTVGDISLSVNNCNIDGFKVVLSPAGYINGVAYLYRRGGYIVVVYNMKTYGFSYFVNIVFDVYGRLVGCVPDSSNIREIFDTGIDSVFLSKLAVGGTV